MLKVIAAGLALTMLVAVPACGGDDDKKGSTAIDCDNLPKSKCPNDMVTDELKNLCKSLVSLQSCKDAVSSLFTCLQDKQICNDAGATDLSATQAACRSQYDNAAACAGADGGT